ncbi:hypothetical protein BGX28_000607 [Mortierella sp. GBA30]|nr:hypothetical protein BGX28_000607 [Mortierella sp. GBA30]
MDKKQILGEATRWFQDTFKNVLSDNTAHEYAEWTLHACPFIKTPGHFLFATKLAIMMIAGDDLFNKREFVLLLKYLRTSTITDDTRFISAISTLFDDFKKIAVLEDNHRDMTEYVAMYLESSRVKKSDGLKDCVIDTCMVPFYIVSLDSNGIRADLGDNKMWHAAYGTRIDNDLISFPKDDVSGYMSDHTNPLLVGSSVDNQIKVILAHYMDQLAGVQQSLQDAIYLQGRVGSLTWMLFAKRYGQILKTVYEDPQTVENIRNSVERIDTEVPHRKEL